jgi:uncharacterized membrane protein
MWIVRLTGLGLVAVCLGGRQIDRRAGEALISADRWLLEDNRRSTAILVALMLAYTVAWNGVSFLRHAFFHSNAFDLGIMDQVVWNTAHGRLFASSYEVSNYLGDHVQPYLALLSPLYLVWPSPYVLLAFQSLALACSAWPLYRLARRRLGSPAAGLIVAFCVLAYPPLGFVNRENFHIEVVAVPLLAAAYERIDAGDLRQAGLWCGLALLAKEEIGLTVAGLALVAAFYHRRWRFGVTWACLGVGYSLLALFVIIPAFRNAPSDTLERYHWLGNTAPAMLGTLLMRPGFVLSHMGIGRDILTFLQLTAPLAFAPLIGLPALVPALPALAINALSSFALQGTVYYHYVVPVIPFMIIAAVLGLDCLTTREGGRKLVAPTLPCPADARRGLGLGLTLLLLAVLASWIYENPVTTNTIAASVTVEKLVGDEERHGSSPPIPLILPNLAAVREGLKQVPDGVALVTTDNYAPHLSHRREIGLLYGDPPEAVDPEVEAVFLNLTDLRVKLRCEDFQVYLASARDAGFGVTYYRESVVLVERGKGDTDGLRDLLARWPGCD